LRHTCNGKHNYTCNACNGKHKHTCYGNHKHICIENTNMQREAPAHLQWEGLEHTCNGDGLIRDCFLRSESCATGSNLNRFSLNDFSNSTSPFLGKVLLLKDKKKGTVSFLPRIDFNPDATECPFEFTRRQFPVKPAYAMTINKS